VDELAAALTRLDADAELRRQLVQRGLENARRFSWDESARRLWQNVESALRSTK
jgi:glycosyltransferase involved in cell wall biosynthesis